MSLKEYRRKRHFQKTPEPKGKAKGSDGRTYVIQKHAASHLHYDFRLELEGTLKSWAVPKGPCLDPSVKRLAMQVEDHPVEYGLFEGIIPEGEYGAGTVMLWDRGEWEPIGDPHEGYRAGKLKFRLHGEKLGGGWVLVRAGGKYKSDKQGRQWLLFKERDYVARPLSEGDILEEMPLSASTGRSLSDIAADSDRTWSEKPQRSHNGKCCGHPIATALERHRGGQAPPKRIDVELATRAEKCPEGDEWLHEVKFDGYRIICRIDGGHVNLISRNHKDWTDRFPTVAKAVRKLPVKQLVLDGEIVALRPDGISDFQKLQNAAHGHSENSLHYFVFDILYKDGQDLTQAPLSERKEVLAQLFAGKGIAQNLHLSDYVAGQGADCLREACKQGLEGIVSKRRDRPYLPGRGADWLKVKCIQTGEFVIGGYTDPSGSRLGFGALLLGYHNGKGDLIYAGKVGTGYDDETLKALSRKIESLEQDTSPFKDYQRAPRGSHWVNPVLVAQVAFGSRTRDDILRHASFQGLREDKSAEEVTQEKPLPLAAALRKTKKL